MNIQQVIFNVVKLVGQYNDGIISSTDMLVGIAPLTRGSAFDNALFEIVKKEKMEEEELSTPF